MSQSLQNCLALLFVLVGFALSGIANITVYLKLTGATFFVGGALFSFAVAVYLIFRRVK